MPRPVPAPLAPELAPDPDPVVPDEDFEENGELLLPELEPEFGDDCGANGELLAPDLGACLEAEPEFAPPLLSPGL